MPKNPVDAYLAKTPEPQRRTLAALRKTIRAALPYAEETVAYGLPCFKVDGKGIAGFAAFTDHCSYFPMSGSVLGVLEKAVAAYVVSKGALQFPVHKTLPVGLVKKLIKARLAETSAPPKNGTGPARTYYDNGVLQSQGSLKGGAKHGSWKWFRKDGTLMRSGQFKAGKQVGIWRTWDTKGRLVKETAFRP